MSINEDFRRKMLVVVTEAALESHLTRDLDRLGAPGYTISDARGRGERGVRSSGWEAESNIRVEVICDDETARRIADHLRERYYQNYAMILSLSDVEVLRPEKFKG